MRKHRIAFVTIWYPVAMGRYMADALRRRPDCEVWTAGPFTGRWIPWMGGMTLPEEYVFTPDWSTPCGPGNPPSADYAELQARAPAQMDLWIEANAGLLVRGRPASAPYIVIGTDPHVLDYGPARRSADAFYCMQTPYMRPGDRYLPYAYDPVWHTPTRIPFAERRYDAALVGLPYPHRQALADALRQRGLKVLLQNGPAYSDAADIYHSTRIGLHYSSLLDTAARVYELMAFGIVPLLNRTPDLMTFFREDRDFVAFGDIGEAAWKASELIQAPEAAAELATAARRAVEPHTWDARMAQVLEECGLALEAIS